MKRIIILAALLHAPFAGAVYKCVDEKGITRIGETPPDECGKVVIYEMKPNGQVIRKIEPTPSPDQLAKLKEDGERKRAADKAAAEQKRKDEALLSTYASDRELDVARDRNIEPIRNRIRTAEERLKSIEARQAKIDEEMEFYKSGKKKSKGKGDAPPPMLVSERESLEKEKQSVTVSIASSEKEIEAMRVRYDTDKKRWQALKAGTPGATAQAEPAAAAVPTKAVRKN